MPENSSSHVNHLQSLRLEKGLSLKELATHFNDFITCENLPIKKVSYATLSRWENGISEPKRNVWEALASYFEVPIDFISSPELSFEEEKVLVENIILDFFQPYRIGYDNASYLTRDDALFLSHKLQNNYNMQMPLSEMGDPSDLMKNFDITGSLDRYLNVFFPTEYNKLALELRSIEFDNKEIVNILKLEKSAIKKIFPLFIDKLTLDAVYFDDSVPDAYAISSIVYWLKFETEKKETELYPKLKQLNKISSHYSIGIKNPIENINSIVHDIITKKGATSDFFDEFTLEERKTMIIKELDEYFNEISKLID